MFEPTCSKNQSKVIIKPSADHPTSPTLFPYSTSNSMGFSLSDSCTVVAVDLARIYIVIARVVLLRLKASAAVVPKNIFSLARVDP